MEDDWEVGDEVMNGAAAVGWEGTFQIRVWYDYNYASYFANSDEARSLRDAIDRWLNEGGK